MLGFRKKIMPVQTYGSPILKTLAAPIPEITPRIEEIAAEMIETMFAFDGIGLAAPQAGIGIRLVTLGIPSAPERELSPGEQLLLPMMPLAMINPVIISSSADVSVCEEGCLSVPDIYAPVERPNRIVLQTNILGHGPIMIECGGLLARCIQHEIDHLDGKLFVERIQPAAKPVVEQQLSRLFDQGKKHNFQRNRK